METFICYIQFSSLYQEQVNNAPVLLIKNKKQKKQGLERLSNFLNVVQPGRSRDLIPELSDSKFLCSFIALCTLLSIPCWQLGGH